MKMRDYVLNRLLQAIPLLFGITVLIFLMLLVLPGNPARLIQGVHANPETTAYLIEKWGLDQPVHIRYIRWLSGVVRLNFGKSLITNEPILPTIGAHLINTMYLGIPTLLLGSLLAILLGTYSAAKPNSTFDGVMRIAALVGLSTPVFWSGMMLQLFFSVKLGVLPVSGMEGAFLSIERLTYLILPMSSIIAAGTAMDSRILRSSMLEILNKEFILAARAKGLSNSAVLRVHALPNGFLPFFTMFGMHLRYMLGGGVVIEMVFAWPGLGLLFYESIIDRDYPMIQAIALLIATGVFLINIIVDITYAYLDPRIRFENIEGK